MTARAERLYALVIAQDACLQRPGTILRTRRTTFGVAYIAQVILFGVAFEMHIDACHPHRQE